MGVVAFHGSDGVGISGVGISGGVGGNSSGSSGNLDHDHPNDGVGNSSTTGIDGTVGGGVGGDFTSAETEAAALAADDANKPNPLKLSQWTKNRWIAKLFPNLKSSPSSSDSPTNTK